jgi:CRP/FNR family transcriptional regulator, dissimilatory nitrate respiration regulator
MLNLVEYFKNIFLFKNLSDEDLNKIKNFSQIRKLKKNEILFNQGEEAAAFFIVYEGSLKISKFSEKGNEQLYHVQQPTDLVAEASIFGEGIYPATCIALEASAIIEIQAKAFKELIIKTPNIALKLLYSYSMRLRSFARTIDSLSLLDVKGRLAKFLIDNSRLTENKRIVELSVSKKELAQILGTIPETFSRTIQLFKKEKLISEKDKVITILDFERLKGFFT